MQSKKESNLFEKLVKKNYKNELEEVLEEKFFGENAKSLLLEILYKIEAAYKDYEIVKKDAKSKDEYTQNFIKTIKDKCKTIKIVKPNSEQSKLLNNRTFIVNKNKSEIICLPIARKLLYAIAKIDKKEKIVNERYYLLSRTFSNMINVGDNINTVEPLRDFNGWSWTTVPREYESIEYNLIYQILILLVGQKFLTNWIKHGDSIIDYVEELENILEYKYGQKIKEEIIDTLNKLSVLMEVKVNNNIKSEIEESKLKIEKALAKFENKQEYIKELTIQKNELKEKIKQIDTIINDKNLLQEEYVRRNEKLPLEEKIFSMRILAEMMIEEREKLFKEMEKANSLLKPQNFFDRKEELERELNILSLANVHNIDIELRKNLKKLQENFLECFKIKINKVETKQEIIELIYRFRYYCLLPYNENENIFAAKEIQSKLNETSRLLIKKAIELRTIVEFSQYENLNYKIMKNLFQVRIILLEEISMKLIKEKEEYFVQFFDDKAVDKKIRLDVENMNKKELQVRPNKKVKLFE